MNTIMKLGEFGEVLSGRSKGAEVVNHCLHGETPQLIHLNFEGVRSFTQSFVSGLLVELYQKGIDLNQVTFEGITENDLTNRFNREKERLISLYYGDTQKSQTS